MAAFTHLTKKFIHLALKPDIRHQFNNNCALCVRLLSYTSKEYDANPDPGPVFIKPEVQSLLKTLTRIDVSKVYKTQKLGNKHLEQPVYKFMTSEQLEEAVDKMKNEVEHRLQMPPVVSVRKPINRILSKDPALQGLETSPFIFTDITYGVRDTDRIILVRDTDGTLKEADWETRDKVNQIYFPISNRILRPPKMFEDGYFGDVLKRKEYVFILDRACLQFEPNDPLYHKIVTITYQCINDNSEFEVLRSTRHFGPFSFFLAWNKMIDNLLLELIETETIDEANALVELYSQIHKIKLEGDGNLKAIDGYVKDHSNKKGALELAVQAYKNAVKRKQELDAGMKRAHGHN